MAFSHYQAALSISKFTLPARTDPLNFYSRNFHQNFHVSMDGFALFEAALILVIFPMCVYEFRCLRFGEWLYMGKTHFPSRRLICIFCGKIQIYWPLMKKIVMESTEKSIAFTLPFPFQKLIVHVPASLDYVLSRPP